MSKSRLSTPLSPRSGTRSGVRAGTRGGIIELRIRPHRAWWVQLLLAVWRWRAELVAVVVGLVLFATAAQATSPTIAGLSTVGVLAVVVAVPPLRRFTVRHLWCTITRHRIRLFFVEAGVYNRSGRLPAVIWVRPTKVGERVWVALAPGLSAGNLDDRLDALAATCWARDARITPVRAVVTFLRVDIIRRDPLAGGRRTRPIRNPLMGRPSDVPVTFTAAPSPAPAATRPPATPTATAAPSSRPGSADNLPEPAMVLRNGEDVSDYVDF